MVALRLKEIVFMITGYLTLFSVLVVIAILFVIGDT